MLSEINKMHKYLESKGMTLRFRMNLLPQLIEKGIAALSFNSVHQKQDLDDFTQAVDNIPELEYKVTDMGFTDGEIVGDHATLDTVVTVAFRGSLPE